MTSATTATATWAEFSREAPELAERVRAAFAVRKHCTLATLRRDGSPRISGTEVQLGPEHLEIGSMPGALKALDLLRDPRCALHSPTVDPPPGRENEWRGEAKLAGRAVEVGSVPGHSPSSHTFRIALTEVVHTRVAGEQLVISSWHPGRGVQERRR
ncbi:MAG TPA: pyridoxamine 5'-phosphate oxidase family protein [Mycobacteriales bacterium]|nr:pyridoxamine 5'-phosphate oxidase family protein [Mycobacteriales bacterium]